MVIVITKDVKRLLGVITKEFSIISVLKLYDYMLSLVDIDINMFVGRLKEDTLVKYVRVSELQIIMKLNP